MVVSWVGSTTPQFRLGQHMHTTLHAAVVSHHQLVLIVTLKTACAKQIVTVTIRPLWNNPGRKIQSLIVQLKLCRMATASQGVNRYSVGWCGSECHSVQLGVAYPSWHPISLSILTTPWYVHLLVCNLVRPKTLKLHFVLNDVWSVLYINLLLQPVLVLVQ
jgi:hypothetical protein